MQMTYQIGESDKSFSCVQNISFVHEDVGREGRQGHHEGHRRPDEGHDGHQPGRLLQNDDLVVANAQHLKEEDVLFILIVYLHFLS